MAKKKVEEAKGGGEAGSSRWMLTYLDMVTLLFGVFVIMYAMSKPDARKFDEVSKALRTSFQGGITFFVGRSIGGQTPLHNETGAVYRNEFSKVISSLKPETLANMATIEHDERNIFITVFDQYYFLPGKADLSPEMKRVLAQVVEFLVRNPNYDVRVEGHADERRVGAPDPFDKYDNWNLAGDRALAIIKYVAGNGVEARRLCGVTYGAVRPLYRKDSPEARALNRRVDLVLVTDEGYNPKTHFKDGNSAP